MVACMTCIALASASSIMSLIWVIFCGGLVCTSVHSTLFTVWCILSQIALDCGFLLVKHTSLLLKISNSHWKLLPLNSPPLSYKHLSGQGYQQCQLWVNLSCICSAVLLSTRMRLTKFEAISMQINALISTCWPLTLTSHSPIKWQLLPRVQYALLVWVGDHSHGLLIYIFGNFCISVCQCDSEAWNDDNIGSMFYVTFFHQDVPSLSGSVW